MQNNRITSLAVTPFLSVFSILKLLHFIDTKLSDRMWNSFPIVTHTPTIQIKYWLPTPTIKHKLLHKIRIPQLTMLLSQTLCCYTWKKLRKKVPVHYFCHYPLFAFWSLFFKHYLLEEKLMLLSLPPSCPLSQQHSPTSMNIWKKTTRE